MGFMDKLKVQADQLATKAQQGMATGQQRLGEMQAKKQADALLHDLGAAVYAAQRQGGPHEPIETAMAALDQHALTHGPIDTTPGGGSGFGIPGMGAATGGAAGGAAAGAPTTPPTAAPTAGPATGAQPGDFNLDDL